jgi:Fic family protein
MKNAGITAKIGEYVFQPQGYRSYVPEKFPPDDHSFYRSGKIVKLLDEAVLLTGRLDGMTKLLPDIDFFVFMYLKKEAALSSQIEGTRAKLTDALQAEVEKNPDLPEDVDDILHYIDAMNTGLKRLENIPLSLRLIKEVHKSLLTGARSTHDPVPGEFRRDQNWIDGTSPNDAAFVPPPANMVLDAMGDIEKFFHEYRGIPALIKAGMLHAQFETIHPFRDGNGRVGRLLITFYLCQQKLLRRPVLYLSEFLKRPREAYFNRLEDYRKGKVEEWLEFFLRGVIEVAGEAITLSDKIIAIRERDLEKISQYGKKTSKAALILLKELYRTPMTNAGRVQKVTGFSRQGAYNLIKKFQGSRILVQSGLRKYGRQYVYRDYLMLFDKQR